MSRHITNADLAGGLSKLAPPVTQMVRAHQSIRAERRRTHSRRRHPQRAPRASEDVLQRAEAAYAAGGSLKAVARQLVLDMSDSLVSFGNAVSSSGTTPRPAARFG